MFYNTRSIEGPNMAESKKPAKQVVFELSKNRPQSSRSGNWLELLLGIRRVPVKVRTESKTS